MAFSLNLLLTTDKEHNLLKYLSRAAIPQKTGLDYCINSSTETVRLELFSRTFCLNIYPSTSVYIAFICTYKCAVCGDCREAVILCVCEKACQWFYVYGADL